VEVLPASGTSAPARPPAPETSKQAAAARTMPASTRAEAPTGASSVRVWQALAALAILLWLGTLALLGRRGRRASRDPARASQQLPRNGPARARMLRACALGDLVGAERALLSWARETRPRLHNLGEVAARLDDQEQRDVLAELARVRYAGDPPGALVQRLERAFGRGIAWRDARTAAGPDDDALPPLYPPRAGGEGED
jgi:hypothetical protein